MKGEEGRCCWCAKNDVWNKIIEKFPYKIETIFDLETLHRNKGKKNNGERKESYAEFVQHLLRV